MEEENKKQLEEQKKKLKKQVMILVLLVVIGLVSIYVLYIVTLMGNTIAKPIIYIYPEKEQEVTISVSNPEKFTTTYPKYENSWEVIASPNGDLVDKKTGRKLYALYWEGKDAKISDMSKGFVVKGENTASFLEEKLEVLGLNEREAEEFIIYWLPKMEHNTYNYIYFQTKEEINQNMELKITPEPETLIRVMMEFKGLNEWMDIEEQQLTKVERNGYTVVEWGGTEIK